jgi:MFS family permease
MGGYTATAILSALIAVAQTVWQVGVLRTGAWLTRGLRTPSRNALLTDVVPREAYGRAHGFERAMDNLGAIVGPLLALGLIAVIGLREAICSRSSRACSPRPRSSSLSGRRRGWSDTSGRRCA